MRKFISPVIAGTVLGGLLAATAGSVAHADATNAALATALDLPAGVTVSQAGDARAFGVETRAFNDLPRRFGNGQYAVMSTGRASDLYNMSVPGLQPSTNLDGDDRVSMTFNVDGTASGSCLLMDVVMGTEERVHTYALGTPSDTISLKRSDDENMEYALNAGPHYTGQTAEAPRDVVTPTPTTMSVNAVQYWHGIDQEFERQPDDHAAPLLPAVTPFNHFTSVETFEVPVSAGSDVTLSIMDANNASLDSVALVDRVRLANNCSSDQAAETGLFPEDPAVVVGHRGVQNFLTVDLVPGTPQIERFDASNNGWFPSGVDLRFRWYRYKSTSTLCNDGTLANWEAINDADRQSFAPTINEKGRCLMVLVTGKKDGYRHETFPSPADRDFTPTLNIQDGVFTNLAVPTITAPRTDIRVNDTLTATNGSFTPRPDSYSYQWYADKFPISGESGQTFKVTAAQAGEPISVRVTARRLNFDDMWIQSSQTVPVTNLDFTSTPVPTISGTGVQGKQLTVVPGTWTPATEKFEYEWYADNVRIPSQVRSTLTPTTAMIGQDVHAVVKGIRSGYNPVSRPTSKMKITGASFTSGRVVVSGTAQVGQRLVATADGWSPAAPSKRTFVWKVGARILQRGASTNFTVPAIAVGKPVHVQVIGERSGYAPITVTSASTRPVLAGSIRSTTPRISGTARPGKRLMVSARWTPTPISYRYQWYVGSKRISGATKSTYKIPKKYRSKKIRVRVTATKSGYRTVARYSASKKIAKK